MFGGLNMPMESTLKGLGTLEGLIVLLSDSATTGQVIATLKDAIEQNTALLAEVNEAQTDVVAKEKALDQRKVEIDQLSDVQEGIRAHLDQRKTALDARENDLNQREADLNAAQEAFNAQAAKVAADHQMAVEDHEENIETARDQILAAHKALDEREAEIEAREAEAAAKLSDLNARLAKLRELSA